MIRVQQRHKKKQEYEKKAKPAVCSRCRYKEIGAQ